MTIKENLLVCLIEECSEVQKAITKTLRFGEFSTTPALAGRDNIYIRQSNIEQLQNELTDLEAVRELLEVMQFIAPVSDYEKYAAGVKKIAYMTNIQDSIITKCDLCCAWQKKYRDIVFDQNTVFRCPFSPETLKETFGLFPKGCQFKEMSDKGEI